MESRGQIEGTSSRDTDPRGGDAALSRQSPMVFVIRGAHALFAFFFALCLLHVYISGLSGRHSRWLFLSVGALLGEGLAVAINGGRCPLSSLQLRFGDDKGFFRLFLPKHIVPFMMPSLAVASLVGLCLLFFSWLSR